MKEYALLDFLFEKHKKQIDRILNKKVIYYNLVADTDIFSVENPEKLIKKLSALEEEINIIGDISEINNSYNRVFFEELSLIQERQEYSYMNVIFDLVEQIEKIHENYGKSICSIRHEAERLYREKESLKQLLFEEMKQHSELLDMFTKFVEKNIKSENESKSAA